MAKYRIAVEIGSRATNPDQCDFVYNGCPLAYEEILAIINEPLRQKPPRTKAPTTTTKRTSYGQNFVSTTSFEMNYDFFAHTALFSLS